MEGYFLACVVPGSEPLGRYFIMRPKLFADANQYASVISSA